MKAENVKLVMNQLYHSDKESYEELWKAMRVLRNLGLIDCKLHEAVVEEDARLFDEANS